MILLLLAAAALIAPIHSDWQSNERIGGHDSCAIGLTYKDGTALTLGVNQATARDNVFLLSMQNAKWSIRPGQDLGEVILNTGSYHLGARATAAEGGFYFAVGLIALRPFLVSADEAGISVVRPSKSQTIGTYAAGNAKAALSKFEACFRAKFDHADDPFAQ